MTLEAWLNWFYLVHHVIESSNWSLVLFSSQCQVKTMKSKYYNIQVSYSSCEDLLEIFDGLQIYLSWISFLDENHFCKLRNELHVIDFSKMIWKLVHMTFGSYVHTLLQFSDFSKLLWAIYEFPWFFLIYFWFLILTHSYESLDGLHASFEIFGILFEQWSQFKVEIVKVGKILDCLKFGSADGPRVRGGWSAIHDVFHQRLWSAENCSADSPPMDRGRSARCTGKLRLHRWCVH